MAVQSEKWLTRQQVADLTHVDISTVKRWIRDGLLDVVKINRMVRIRPEALDDLAARRARKALENQPRRGRPRKALP